MEQHSMKKKETFFPYSLLQNKREASDCLGSPSQKNLQACEAAIETRDCWPKLFGYLKLGSQVELYQDGIHCFTCLLRVKRWGFFPPLRGRK